MALLHSDGYPFAAYVEGGSATPIQKSSLVKNEVDLLTPKNKQKCTIHINIITVDAAY